ncbi:MAG: pyridoxamine 5'-phosphate oxidase family protein [Acetivibrionales bacterium]|jgi:hypothetical protein
MTRFEEGLKIIDERCGGGKDNVIALSTVAIEPNSYGKPRPYVREVDAYYENGVFYITTWAKSLKMMQIANNNEVAFAVQNGWINGNGIGENLGWVKDPKNAELRLKLREAFAPWYDFANNEDSEDCIILAIRITRAIVVVNHGEDYYFLDFINKVESREGRIK